MSVEVVIFGKITDEGSRGWKIDAQPFVMTRCRALFKNGVGSDNGEFTHRPLYVPRTMDVAKDLLWLTERYPLDYALEVERELFRLADRYDDSIKAAAIGDTDLGFDLTAGALQMAEPPRPHQIGARNLIAKVLRLLLTDDIGLGKTITGISLLCEAESRPAICVVPTHLTRQWESQLRRFLPAARVIVVTKKPYALPDCDVIIIAYTRLASWQDHLVPRGCSTLIFDEVQALRHVDTEKRSVAKALSKKATVCVGLTATPIYNLGGEIWSVLDAISPDCLGPQSEFVTEWCTGGRVNDPVALYTYLTSRGLMLRRTNETLGIEKAAVTRDVITLDGDLDSLNVIQDVAAHLAMSVLSNVVGVSENAASELDWRLRRATGLAKAKSVAQFVKMLCESGEQVLLAGWHRDVYDVWLRELKALNPAMYTGSESAVQKSASVRSFVSGASQVFICSLRSGEGLDGLQHVCRSVVIGELDWSPQVMNQLIGRVDREGQQRPVNAYFPVIDDGSDPFLLELLGDKLSQHEGVVEGRSDHQGELLSSDASKTSRIRSMAEQYLASIGSPIPTVEPAVGLHAEIVEALRRMQLPSSSERELQDAVWRMLPDLVDSASIEREIRISDRSRLDFLVTRGSESIAIECKIDATGRASVYRQVRRYVETANITGAIILAPWAGISSFVIDDVPVSVVDWSKTRLRV